jgi:hypothetical protein
LTGAPEAEIDKKQPLVAVSIDGDGEQTGKFDIFFKFF